MFGVRKKVAIDQARDLSLATAAQGDQSFGVRRKIFWIQHGWPWIVGWPMGCRWLPGARAFVRQRHESTQVGVAALRLSQQRQVDWAFFFFGEAVCKRELHTRNGLDARRGARLGELHGAMQAIVVGNRQHRVAELLSPRRNLFRQRSPFEEREASMQV